MEVALRLLYITASNDDALRVKDAFREAGQEAEILQVKTPDRLADALQHGPWDAVIADYAPPGFKAPAGLSQIFSAEPDLPYIVLSDPIGEKAVAALFKAGASDYVRRDDLKRLLPVVKRQVHRARVRKKRRDDEEEFEQSERKYRTLFDCASDSMFITDFTGKILDANKTACVRLGYTRLELLRKNIGAIDPDETPAEAAERMEQLKRLGSRVFERVHVTKQGVRFPVEVNTRIFEFGGKKAILSIVRDLSDRKRAEEQIKASLKEKILLLKEIHHRIKNNLQVVMSLLNLQSYHVTDARAQALFRENQLRIRSMALVHERLYQSPDLSHVDFRDYIAKLAVDLYRAYRVDADTVRLSVKVEDIALGVDASVPCGLIINELLLNSLKHAFPRGRKGSITVTLERFAADQLLLTVADDGVGLGKNVDLYGSKSLGFSLVVALTEQLGGSIQLSREAGTKIEILFKSKD